MLKYAGGAIALALMVGGLYWWTRPAPLASAAPPKPVKVARGDISLVVSATGEVKPLRQVELKCKASGQVVRFPKLEGSPVEAGEVIAELDPKTEQRNVEREEAGVALAEGRLSIVRLEHARTLAQAQSAEAAAEAEARTRREDLARVEQLDKSVVTESDLSTARLAARLAEEKHKQAAAELATIRDRKTADESMAEAELRRARASLEDARERRADTQVRSPIKGILLRKLVEEGMIVSSGLTASSGGTAVAVVADVSTLVVETNVDETDIGRVQPGQSATVSVEAHPDRAVRGKVDHIPPRGDLDSSIIVFKVLIGIPGGEFGKLRIGMTASVSLLVEEHKGTLLVPAEAVRNEGGKGRYVLRPGGGRTKVETGLDDGTLIEIVSGLSEGDEVLTSGDGSTPDASRGPRRPFPRF